jgi:hypothetical protein
MNTIKKNLLWLILGVLVVVGVAAVPNRGYDLIPTETSTWDLGDSTHKWDVAYVNTVPSATDITTSKLALTAADVSVTSPTKTVSVLNRSLVAITTNVSQSGFTLTGGVPGQVVVIKGTSDSATVGFTDATDTMALGTSVTLGATDTLTLICTSASPQKYSKVSSADN